MSDFWSRRRAAARAEETAHLRAGEEARGAAIEAEAETDAELCAALDLPDPETLGPGDDVSAFMARVVPQRLRRRALRALWARDPRLANLDGLVDYGGDFTDAGLKAGTVATVYEVGRAAARRMGEERVATDVRRPEADGAVGGPEDPSGEGADRLARGREDGACDRPAADDEAVPGPSADPDPSEAASAGSDPAAGGRDAASKPPQTPRRRMRFTFGEDAA